VLYKALVMIKNGLSCLAHVFSRKS
jgi:hypothetical protein